MTDAAAFQATFVKTVPVGGRKVVQFVFEVPVEKATDALNMLGGFPNSAESVWCGIARLVKPEEAAEKPAQSPKARVASHMTTRAAILCTDPVFWRFLNETYRNSFPQAHVTDEKGAADLVRFLCDVRSRKEIQPDTRAGKKWDDIYTRFVCWRDEPQEVA